MAEDLRIDSHKLIYHPERVSEWINGKNIYPIEAEIGLSSACNHRCTFCALDYTEYKPVFFEKDLILDRLKEMQLGGLKSIILAGEGEPLLNKNTPDIINEAKALGIDVAMSTNGVLLTEDVSEKCLKSLSWIRFSVAAGETDVYKQIHKSRDEDFNLVIKNISDAVKIKRKNNLKVVLGVQLLLIPENTNQVFKLASILKEIGVDYFTVKPFSKHPKSICDVDDSFEYQNYIELDKKLKELETENYKIYFRTNAMEKLNEERGYNQCYGLPFFIYIDAKANIWPCIAFLGDEKMIYGNLAKNTFKDIWESENRNNIVEYFNKNGVNDCREICRLDEINKYLCQLKKPGAHVNFI